MADNVTFTAAADATPPGGTKAATDELADGSHAGIAKLAVSADADRTLIPATAADGLLVEVSNPTAGTGLTDAELRATPVPVSGTVTVGTALPAGNNNVGDVDIATVPAPLSTTGGGTEATALRVTVASNSTGLLPVSGPLTDTQLRATPVPVSGTVTANAGTNLNTSLLALEAGGNLAAAAVSLSVLDDWDESDRAKTNPIVGQAGVQGASGGVTALTQRVVLATDVALPAGTNAIGKLAANSGVDIGDVDVTSVSGTVTTKETRSATGTTSQVSDTASSTTILASNASRLGCSIQNDSSAVLYIKCGTTASATDYTARLVQYSYWEAPANFTGRIDGIWATDPNDGAARVTEYT